MENYLGPGQNVEWTAPSGGVVSGTPVKIGRVLVVPTATALVGEKFVGVVAGGPLVTLPKVTAEPWTEGMLVWWNSASGLASSISTTSMWIGVATRVEANPTATGRVLLGAGTWLNQ